MLYGLLEQGKNFEPHIREVLRGWKLEEVEIEDIGFFESPYPDEKYWCIVAHIKKNVIPKWKGVRFIQDPPMQFPLRGEICTSTFLVSPFGMWIELTSWSESKHKGQVISAQRQRERHQCVGKHISELLTPAFMVDLDIVDHNVNLMRSRIADQGLQWRIPSKAHKCPALAQYILDRGATGVVLLTLAEAEAFARHGIHDIYLANQVGTQDELTRLSLLAKVVQRLRVAVDNADYLRELVAAIQQWEIITSIEVLVELNINHHRCGVHVAEAVELAKLAHHLEQTTGAIVFAGITGYEGHTPILPPAEKTQETDNAHDILAQAKLLIEAEGIEVKNVSGGGSCNYMDALHKGVLTEVQAGGGAIGDLLYYHQANLKDHGHLMGALLLTQIISMPGDQSRAIGNAGFKAAGFHPFGGLPQPRDRHDLQVIGLSAEHTRMTAVNKGDRVNLARGDKLVLIPGYTDAMGFLHKEIYAIRKDQVQFVWKTI